MKFYCSGLYGGGDYYVIPEEGLRNNLLLHSGPIFSDTDTNKDVNKTENTELLSMSLTIYCGWLTYMKLNGNNLE